MDLQLHSAHNSNSSLPAMQALCFSASMDAMSDGGLLSIESHRSVPAPFLTKTYQLVDDPTTDHIVSWGEDESTFVVWRPPEFARDLLPNYFKHNNFSSFVRQLNTYGFRKIVPDRWEFANEFFRKGEKHLLCEIHRRKTAQNTRSSPTNSTEDLIMQQQGAIPPWSPLSSSIESPSSAAFAAVSAARHAGMHQAAAAALAHSSMPHFSGIAGRGSELSLSDENERLRHDNTLLLSELTRMKKLYHDILLYVQHQNMQPQGQASRTICGSTSFGQASELSSQASNFYNISSSQRGLVYHSPSMSAVQKVNMDSPTSRLTCAKESVRTLVSSHMTPIPYAVPVSNYASQPISSIPGRAVADMALLQSSYTNNVEQRNTRTPAAMAVLAAPATSTLSISTSSEQVTEISHGAKDIAEVTGEKSPLKLFGVPLQSAGRKRGHEEDGVLHSDQHLVRHGDKLMSKSSVTPDLIVLKSAKTSELALELKQPNMSSTSSMHAPWLKFNASRDEKVYN